MLAERIRVSASLVSAEPATVASPRRQLRELRESPFGRWLRPSSDGRRPRRGSPSTAGRRGIPGRQAADIDLGRAIADRAVVLFRLGGPSAAESSAMLDRLICQDLLGRAGVARDGTSEGGTSEGGTSGADGDGLIWLAECAALPRQAVTSLIARAGLPGCRCWRPPRRHRSRPISRPGPNVVIAHRMAAGAAAPWVANSAAAPWVANSRGRGGPAVGGR